MGSIPGSLNAGKGRSGYSRPGRNARSVLKRTQMVHPELIVISDHSSRSTQDGIPMYIRRNNKHTVVKTSMKDPKEVCV